MLMFIYHKGSDCNIFIFITSNLASLRKHYLSWKTLLFRRRLFASLNKSVDLSHEINFVTGTSTNSSSVCLRS